MRQIVVVTMIMSCNDGGKRKRSASHYANDDFDDCEIKYTIEEFYVSRRWSQFAISFSPCHRNGLICKKTTTIRSILNEFARSYWLRGKTYVATYRKQG